MKDVRPTANNDLAKVKVKVQVNLHGILVVEGATLTEKLTPAEIEAESKEAMDSNSNQDLESAPMENGGDDVKDRANEVTSRF